MCEKCYGDNYATPAIRRAEARIIAKVLASLVVVVFGMTGIVIFLLNS